MRSTKSRKQVTQNTESPYKDTVETPFAVGLGILVHKETRNRKMIEYLSDLGLSISYKKVMKIENGLGNMIVEKQNSNEGVYIPDNLTQNSCLHFAIDNIDVENDTANGKGEFHRATTVIFQKKQNQKEKSIEITPTNDVAFQHTADVIHPCNKPVQPNEVFEQYNDLSSIIDISHFTNRDRLWGMLQVVDVSQMCQLPTWNAFNSLLTKTPSVTLCETLPLSPISPTDWTVLYAALKQAQEINMKVFPNKKTIVTLDLQLYAKCMELRSRNKIKYKLIFKLEELNIVFAFLKVLGKYINCCGLDQILVDTDTYGSTTLSQILNGKHMKQGFEAHIILCLSLSNLFYNDLLKVYPLTQLNLADELAKLKSNIQSSK